MVPFGLIIGWWRCGYVWDMKCYICRKEIVGFVYRLLNIWFYCNQLQTCICVGLIIKSIYSFVISVLHKIRVGSNRGKTKATYLSLKSQPILQNNKFLTHNLNHFFRKTKTSRLTIVVYACGWSAVYFCEFLWYSYYKEVGCQPHDKTGHCTKYHTQHITFTRADLFSMFACSKHTHTHTTTSLSNHSCIFYGDLFDLFVTCLSIAAVFTLAFAEPVDQMMRVIHQTPNHTIGQLNKLYFAHFEHSRVYIILLFVRQSAVDVIVCEGA